MRKITKAGITLAAAGFALAMSAAPANAESFYWTTAKGTNWSWVQGIGSSGGSCFAKDVLDDSRSDNYAEAQFRNDSTTTCLMWLIRSYKTSDGSWTAPSRVSGYHYVYPGQTDGTGWYWDGGGYLTFACIQALNEQYDHCSDGI